MVADTGATPLPGSIRPLDSPQLVRVHLDDNGVPKVVQLKPALSSSNGHALSSHPLVRSQRKIKTDRTTTSGSTSSPRTDATPVRPEPVEGPALSSSNGPALSPHPLVRRHRATASGSTSSPRTDATPVCPESVEGPTLPVRPEPVEEPALSSSNGPALSPHPLVRRHRATASGSTSSPRTDATPVRPELVEGPPQGLRTGSSKGRWRQVLEVPGQLAHRRRMVAKTTGIASVLSCGPGRWNNDRLV